MNGAQRRERNYGQFVKRASFTRSVKETTPAIPGHENGPLSWDCRHRRPDSAVLPRDEGKALIAVLASAPARRPAPRPKRHKRADSDIHIDMSMPKLA